MPYVKADTYISFLRLAFGLEIYLKNWEYAQNLTHFFNAA